MIINIFIIISACLNLSSKFTKYYEMIIAGRFFSGLFSGLSTGILPLYLVEIPPQALRGKIGSTNQLTMYVPYLMNHLVSVLLGSCCTRFHKIISWLISYKAFFNTCI